MPMFFRSYSSIVEGDTTWKQPNSIEAEVCWAVTELEKAAGVEKEEHLSELKVMPEFCLPKPRGDGQPLDWGGRENAHPF